MELKVAKASEVPFTFGNIRQAITVISMKYNFPFKNILPQNNICATLFADDSVLISKINNLKAYI